ncbi:hypothetical protein BJH93_06475 [Kocuria polaris]|nr:hypothetical protein [Kocuria polaris]
MVLGLAVLAIGAMLGFVWAPTPLPPDYRTSSDPTVAVVTEPFSDQRDLAVEITATPGHVVESPADGVITRYKCTVGGTWTSGTAPTAIDGDPLLVLHLSSPPYRTLASGSTGDDVSALGAELARLDYLSEEATTFSLTMETALTELQEATGVPATGTLDPAKILWLPAPSITTAECPAQLGQRQSATQPLAQAAETITELRLPTIPADAVDGERTATVGATTTSVSKDGTVELTDEQRAVLMEDPTVQLATDPDTGVPLAAAWMLAEPLQAAALPPSSLIDSASGFCVHAGDGTPHMVRVLASSLGQTYVSFPDQTPTSIRTEPSAESACSK